MQTIFVSSTFKDMHQERDLLQNKVQPRINREVRAMYHHGFSFQDLRWGIDTDKEGTKVKILEDCLDQIDMSSSFFLILLGDRYNWVTEEAVVDLEKYFEILKKPENKERSLVYIRNIEGQAPEEYFAKDQEEKTKSEELKQALRNILPEENIKTYTVKWEKDKFKGLENLEEMIMEDLEKFLEEETRKLFKKTLEDLAGKDDRDRMKAMHMTFYSYMAGDSKLLIEYLQSLSDKRINVIVNIDVKERISKDINKIVQKYGTEWFEGFLDQLSKLEWVEIEKVLAYIFPSMQVKSNGKEIGASKEISEKFIEFFEKITKKTYNLDTNMLLCFSYYIFAHLNSIGEEKDLEKAEEFSKKLLNMQKSLLDEFNDSIFYKGIIMTNNLLATIYLEAFESDKKVEKHYREAIEYHEALVEKFKNDGYDRTLSIFYTTLADFLLERSELEKEEAKQYYKKAIKVLENTDFEYGGFELESDLVDLYGIFAKKYSEGQESIIYYKKAIETQEIIVKEERTTKNELCLAGLYNSLADLYYEEEEMSFEAKKYYKQAIEIAEDISSGDDTTSVDFDLKNSYENLAFLSSRETLEERKEEVDCYEKLIKLSDGDKETISYLYMEISNTYFCGEKDELEKAKYYYKKVIDSSEDFISVFDYIDCLQNIAYLYMQGTGADRVKAEYYCKRAVEKAEDSVKNIFTPDIKEALSVSYNNLAYFYSIGPDEEQKKSEYYYGKAIEVAEELVYKLDLDDDYLLEIYRTLLLSLYLSMGKLYSQGDKEELEKARAYFKKAMEEDEDYVNTIFKHHEEFLGIYNKLFKA